MLVKIIKYLRCGGYCVGGSDVKIIPWDPHVEQLNTSWLV